MKAVGNFYSSTTRINSPVVGIITAQWSHWFILNIPGTINPV